jgi:hypothetical protein
MEWYIIRGNYALTLPNGRKFHYLSLGLKSNGKTVILFDDKKYHSGSISPNTPGLKFILSANFEL